MFCKLRYFSESYSGKPDNINVRYVTLRVGDVTYYKTPIYIVLLGKGYRSCVLH